ncbi:adenine deaminase [Pectinatus sottacetonis]|uniref:adenine deaminase n=1 Tax=Pectinatus sottacetonis TaxID=1002795 RepID=UPI0018C7EAB0|nr:adenine deaminase [Pectinatus sottacetonis]
MEKEYLRKLIDTAKGRRKADLVLKNCQIVDVYNAKLIKGDIAVAGASIAGIGKYTGSEEKNMNGGFVIPGLIDSHIHIESSCVSPEEIGALLVPHGTSTIIADPHEIVNVCGMNGLAYMIKAAANTRLDIKYMMPSCVPATPFEHAGANITADVMRDMMASDKILGLGEFMNFPGVIAADEEVLAKILTAKENGKIIDGHGPGLAGNDLNTYIAAGISDDHECTTVEEMNAKLERGMYILLRNGSACHDLIKLVKGVTAANERRCLLCSDDRQPKTIFSKGHLEDHLRICVRAGLDPFTAIRMATINAAECFGLTDRGGIAPGKKADLVVVDDLENFNVSDVYIDGILTASRGQYLPQIKKYPINKVTGTCHVKDFSQEKLSLKLTSNKVKTIDIMPDGVVTGQGTAIVQLNENSEFVYSPDNDIVKIAVIERHKYTGNVATGLLRNYGIKKGAVAVSIAHDSHNIIAVGTNDKDIYYAVNELIKHQGGIVLSCAAKTIAAMPMPIAGIMSDKDGRWVNDKLTIIHKVAYEKLGINRNIDPIMTLCFMALPVIPKLKITDMGLFDVTKFAFTSVEA